VRPVPPRRVAHLYRKHLAGSRRERLFLSSCSFFTTFAATRGITHAIRHRIGPFRNVSLGGRHVHHLVLGIAGLLGTGYLWLVQVGIGVGDSPQAGDSPATGDSPGVGDSPATGDSPQAGHSPGTGDSPEVGGGHQPIGSPKADDRLRDGVSGEELRRLPDHSTDALSKLTSVMYGAASAITLDEFALWLNLQDVYWTREGRESIDAVILFGGALSVGLWGGPFFRALYREARRIG